LARVDRPRRRADVPGPPRLVDAGSDLSARLERWAAEARVDDAARARSREAWLRRQAAEEGTLAGVLSDLLDAAAPVTVQTRGGGRHGGVVRTVGADFVALGSPGRRGSEVVVAVALRAVASVRTVPGAPDVTGDRRSGGSLRLADVVAGLVAEREPVRVMTDDGEAIAGVVVSVGRDVAVVQGAGVPPSSAYVPLEAVSAVVVGG
jgi:hypothetical protein